MDTPEQAHAEEPQSPEIGGASSPDPAPVSPENPEAAVAAMARTNSSADDAIGENVPPVEGSSWLADNWRWIAASVLVFALLMYPIVHRLMNRPAVPNAASTIATGNLPDLLTLSLQYYQAKRFPEAIAISKGILEINPNSADAYNNMAVSYAAMGQWNEAEASLQAALRISPNYQLAKNNLAWVSAERQKTAPKEGTAEFFLNRSLVEYQAHHYPESTAAALVALRLRPDYAEAYNNLCVAYIGLQQYDLAIQAGQNAVRVKPDFALAKNNLAWALSEKQKAAKK
jgi:tetratricopeptide (TPR) repeat protein